MLREILIAGFGGQGILFCGKFLAYKGLLDDKQVSWLPSYGPAMRGGTANCSIVLSDENIGSPIVLYPDVLVAMNKPSFEKYEKEIKTGGLCFVDTTLIDSKEERKDITYFNIPATKIATDNGIAKLANMVMIGYVVKMLDEINKDDFTKAMGKLVPANKKELLDMNMKALNLGLNFVSP